jgi:tetratricopeptide (TPR) repeat protein
MVGSLHNLGETQREAGRLDAARASFIEGLAIANEVGDDLNASLILTGLGNVDVIQGRLTDARASLEDALTRARKTGQAGQAAIVLRELARLTRAEGEIDAARHLLERAADMLAGLDRAGDLAGTIEDLGQLLEPIEPDTARVLFARALAIFRDGGYLWGTASVLARFARLALEDGHADRCMELMGGVDALSPVEAARGSETIERARSALGTATSEACWTAGHVMSLDQLQRVVDDLIPALQISIAPAGSIQIQSSGASRSGDRTPARTSAAAGSGGAPAGSG